MPRPSPRSRADVEGGRYAAAVIGHDQLQARVPLRQNNLDTAFRPVGQAVFQRILNQLVCHQSQAGCPL